MSVYMFFWHRCQTAGAYMFLQEPVSHPSLQIRPHFDWVPQHEPTYDSGPAEAPVDSRRRALSSLRWRVLAVTAVRPEAVGWRARRWAESNKWSNYPITSLSTSVRHRDMARCKTYAHHLVTMKNGILKRFSRWRSRRISSFSGSCHWNILRMSVRLPAYCEVHAITYAPAGKQRCAATSKRLDKQSQKRGISSLWSYCL